MYLSFIQACMQISFRGSWFIALSVTRPKPYARKIFNYECRSKRSRVSGSGRRLVHLALTPLVNPRLLVTLAIGQYCALIRGTANARSLSAGDIDLGVERHPKCSARNDVVKSHVLERRLYTEYVLV